MTRASNTVPPGTQMPTPGDALQAALQSQLQWADEVMRLQSTWLSGWLAFHLAWWQNCSAGVPELPAWMVWHNGTEQLA